MTTVTAHGATISVDRSGVHVERTPMGQTLLPPTLDVSPADLRGWYHHAPTATSPGWIQFSLAGNTDRPLRGYPATHGASTVVAFAPGQQDAFVAANAALTALQGGYPMDDSGSDHGDAASAGSPLSLFELPEEPAADPEPTASPASSDTTRSSKSGNGGKSGKSGRGSWNRVATPDTLPEPDLTADADGPVFGQNVTVTGDFQPYEKGEVWDMIAAAGGTVGKNVTKKTTVLVLGTWDSVTSKEKRARELQEKGQDIQLWTFAEFLEKVGRTARPDISEVKGTDAPF